MNLSEETGGLIPMMDAVRRFGVTRPWLRRRIDKGLLRTYASGIDGRVRLVDVAELRALLNRRQSIPAGGKGPGR